MTRRYYQGPPDKQPKDCGRRHPQPLCMCVLCEVAARFASITKLQRQRELLHAVRPLATNHAVTIETYCSRKTWHRWRCACGRAGDWTIKPLSAHRGGIRHVSRSQARAAAQPRSSR